MSSFPVSHAPHIHSGNTVASFYWKKTLALLPVLAAAVWSARLEALKITGIALAAGLLAESCSRIFPRNRFQLKDGPGIFLLLNYSLLLSSGCPFWQVAVGAAVCILIGKDFFGGPGGFIFHPALVAFAVLKLSFPNQAFQGLVGTGIICSALVFAGAVLLIAQRLVRWEMALFYLAGIYLFAVVLGAGPRNFLSPVMIFISFFIVTDQTVAPLTRAGQIIYTLGAALLTVAASRHGLPAAAVFAVLVLNAVNPWLDFKIRPRAVSL